METKLVSRRSFSAVPSIKVPSSYNEVTRVTGQPGRGSRVIFFDENENEISYENNESCQQENSNLSKVERPRRSNALLVKRRSSSLDAARFTAWYNRRRNSNVRRDQFLQSFGKATIGYPNLYPNLNDEDIMEHMSSRNVPVRMNSIVEAGTDLNDSYDFRRRTQFAGPVLIRSSSSTKMAKVHENLLELRGSEYTGDAPDLNLTAKIRNQSARRRIKRIMEAEKELEEQGGKAMEEEAAKRKEKEKKKTKTWRSATFAVMAMNVSAAGFSFKSFTEKKKWVTEKRLWTKQIARTKFRWAVRVVIVFGRVLKVLMSHSANIVPETATQRSFRTLRDNSEAKEVLFNKSLYQRGKSQYAYVPEWAKRILQKPALERTGNELSQLHSMLKGLTSYDKFTYRIQLAMCKAMTYIKVEHPRVVLRKGHIGVSFYFIFSGSVFVNVEELLVKTGHVMWHTAVTLQRGDSFGELALLRNIRRTASVVVREGAELLVIEKDVFSKTCPKIFEKELVDKITFCKHLPLFERWTDDALKSLCIKAQIQEWKANKIIVKDSSMELGWIYLCMQGKCSVIKVLDLHVPPKVSRPRRIPNEDIYYPIGIIRKKKKSQSDTSKLWIKGLHESLKTSYILGENKKVDEHRRDNESNFWSDSECESSEEEATGAEKILAVMDLSYKDKSHAKGDSSYIVNEEDEDEDDEDETEHAQIGVEVIPSELEKRDKNIFEDFSELIKIDSKAGKLNKDVVYLNIASMKTGDIFDISQVFRPTGRKLMLVSKGAVMLRIKRDDFFRYSTKQTLRHYRKVVQEFDYPSEEIIYRSYNERCAWEQLKSTQLQSTMNGVQEKRIRHNNSFSQSMPEVKRPLTPARIDNGPSSLERYDQFLSFVFGSHKEPESETEESVSSFVAKIALDKLQNGAFKQLNSKSEQRNTTKKVCFSSSQ